MPVMNKSLGNSSFNLFATLSGLLTILLWSSLAIMTTFVASIPRFELLWFGFGISFLIGTFILALTGRLNEMKQLFKPWIIGFSGIFFFHLFYFSGLALAPPAQVTLMSYLWPTMLVVSSAFLNKQQFHVAYLVGVLMGLAGTVFLMYGGEETVFIPYVLLGYFLGFLCAVVWTIYSLVNRKYVNVPAGMLIGVCGGISLVAMLIHFSIESTIVPSFKELIILIYIGCGPMGIAFLAWDYASKNANMSLLGSLAYLAPLLSMVWLVIARKVPVTFGLVMAVILIVGGAIVATYPLKYVKE